MPRTKSDTIKAMGLEDYMNTKFAHMEAKFGMKPYEKFTASLHLSDTALAAMFGKKHPQSATNWRTAYNERKVEK